MQITNKEIYSYNIPLRKTYDFDNRQVNYEILNRVYIIEDIHRQIYVSLKMFQYIFFYYNLSSWNSFLFSIFIKATKMSGKFSFIIVSLA